MKYTEKECLLGKTCYNLTSLKKFRLLSPVSLHHNNSKTKVGYISQLLYTNKRGRRLSFSSWKVWKYVGFQDWLVEWCTMGSEEESLLSTMSAAGRLIRLYDTVPASQPPSSSSRRASRVKAPHWHDVTHHWARRNVNKPLAAAGSVVL